MSAFWRVLREVLSESQFSEMAVDCFSVKMEADFSSEAEDEPEDPSAKAGEVERQREARAKVAKMTTAAGLSLAMKLNSVATDLCVGVDAVVDFTTFSFLRIQSL